MGMRKQKELGSIQSYLALLVIVGWGFKNDSQRGTGVPEAERENPPDGICPFTGKHG